MPYFLTSLAHVRKPNRRAQGLLPTNRLQSGDPPSSASRTSVFHHVEVSRREKSGQITNRSRQTRLRPFIRFDDVGTDAHPSPGFTPIPHRRFSHGISRHLRRPHSSIRADAPYAIQTGSRFHFLKKF